MVDLNQVMDICGDIKNNIFITGTLKLKIHKK
jgi:hypothetical protein